MKYENAVGVFHMEWSPNVVFNQLAIDAYLCST